jgi:hypothetical protein
MPVLFVGRAVRRGRRKRGPVPLASYPPASHCKAQGAGDRAQKETSLPCSWFFIVAATLPYQGLARGPRRTRRRYARPMTRQGTRRLDLRL